MKHTKEVAVIDRYAIHTPIFYCNFFFRYATITLRKSNLPTVRYCSIHFLYILLHHIYITFFRFYTFINMVKRLHSYLLLTGTLLYSAALPINAQGNTVEKKQQIALHKTHCSQHLICTTKCCRRLK